MQAAHGYHLLVLGVGICLVSRVCVGIPAPGSQYFLIVRVGVSGRLLHHALLHAFPEQLLAGKENALLSKELATIKRDVPIDFEKLDFSFDAPDVARLTTFYKELGLTKLLRKLEAEFGTTTLEDVAAEAPSYEGTVCADVDQALALLAAITEERCVLLCEVNEEKLPTRFSWRVGGKNATVAVASCHDWDRIVDVLDKLFEREPFAVYTDDAKKLAHALLLSGSYTEQLRFDVALAAYLLQPEGEHELERVYEGLLGKSLPEEEPARIFAALEAVEELQPEMNAGLVEIGAAGLYSNVELPLVWILAQMEIVGVKVDVPYLEKLQVEFDERIRAIEKDIEVLAGEPVNPNSPKQLGHILFEVLELPVVKKTKTGYSTSAEVLEALRDSHPIVGRVLDYRQLAKLKSTYVDGLLKLVDAHDRVHTSFNQTVTATGRLSSTAPNLQNIPVRTEEGKRIRRAFIPIEKKNLLISADYSQIELRVLAHLSGDDMLMQSFAKGEDIHRRTASEVFHVPMEEVTAEQRRTAKAVNFGIIYGQTDYGLSTELGISRREAQAYIDLYFSRYPLVQTFIHDTIEQARAQGYVTTMMGRRRYIKDINSRNRNLRQFAERTAVNSPIQGTAADIIKLAMIHCDKAIEDNRLDAKMLLQVHDELIFEVSREDALGLSLVVRKCMEDALKLNVPLKVDLKAGFNWQEMEKI